MDSLDELLNKSTPKKAVDVTPVNRNYKSIDDLLTSSKPAPGFVPPKITPQVTVPDRPVEPVKKASVLNRAMTSFDNLTARPDPSELGTDANKNFWKFLPSSIVESLPFGVGSIVKTARDDPEAVAAVDFEDVLVGIRETSKGVFKGLVTAGTNFYPKPLKIDIPVLGEVTNREFNTAHRIAAGEDQAIVLLEEGSGAIFDSLFILGLASEVAAPRPTTVGTKVEVPKNSGITVKNGPKSFRLYEEPVYTKSLDPQVVTKMAAQQGIKLKDFNPELPSYFKMTGKANGKIVAEVVQVRPSYFNVLKNTFGTAKDPVYKETVQSLKNSGHDLDRAIESGDMAVDKVYKSKGGELTPTYAEHTVTDLTLKLNEVKPGLGDKFKATVDLSKPTPTNLSDQAVAILTNSLTTKPQPIPAVLPQAYLPPHEVSTIVKKEITADPKQGQNNKLNQILPKLKDNPDDQHIVESARSLAESTGDPAMIARVNEAIALGEKNLKINNENAAKLDQFVEGSTPSPEKALTNPPAEPYRPARVRPANQVYANTPESQFLVGEYGGKPFTTDAYILEFNSSVQPPAKAQVITASTPNSKVPSAAKIKEIVPADEDLQIVEPSRVFTKEGNKNEFVDLSGDNVDLTIQRRYLDYFSKKYPNAVFMAVKPNQPVVVKQNGENVGLIMPMANLKEIRGKEIEMWKKPAPAQPSLRQAKPAKVTEVKKEVKIQKPKALSGGELGSYASPQGNKTIRKIMERQNEAKVEDVQEVPKDFKISERAKQILEEFGIPVGEKSLSGRLLGVYKPLTKKVRVQALYDVTTVTHEAIHAIDDQIKFSEKLIESTGRGAEIRKRLTDIYEELYPIGNRAHKLDKRIKEGLAVLFENYFYDPASIQATYPDLVNAFIKPEGQYYNSQFTKLLDSMNELVEDYAKLTLEQRIGSRIRTGKEVVDQQTGFTFKQRLEFELFNRFEPLKRYAKESKVAGTWDDPLVQAFNILNKNTIITNWVKGHDTPILMRDGNFKIEKGSVGDYLKMIKGSEKEFRSYLVARRVVEDNNKLRALKNASRERTVSVNELVTYEDAPDLARIEEYKTKIKNGEVLEPLKVIKDENGLGVEDGKHRLEAYKQLGMTEVSVQEMITNKAMADQIAKLEKTIQNDDFSLQDATAVVEKYSEQFKEAEELYDSINRRLIDMAEQNDLISADTAKQYREEKGYASFKRYIDEELASVGTIKTSSKSKVTSFKERTGSQLDIIDPIYSQIMSINEIIGKGMENRLWSKVADLAKNNPEVSQRFERVEANPAIDGEGNISFPQEKDPGTIRIFRKGQREFYKVAPEFAAVAKQLRGKEFDAFVQMLRIPASLFTRLTTSANPLFAVGNLSVDQFTATAQTKTGFRPIVDPIKSLYAYATGDQGVRAYMAMGGKRQTLAAFYDLSPDSVVHKLTGGQTKVEKVAHVIDTGLGVLEMPANTSEIMTRFSEYQRSVEQGMPMSVAMYRASEVTTPFQLQGNFGGRFGQEAIKSIPYLNAIIQVLYKYGRATKDNPKRVGTVMAALLVAGLTAAILTYKNASEKQKRLLAEQPVRNASRYLYFPSPNGEDLLRMRIPEQMGVLTGMAYLFVAEHYGKNKATFDDYVDTVASAVPEQVQIWDPKKMILSWLPQALKPSIQVAANTKTFPEVGPIIPPYMIDKAPKEQYNAYTSESAKTIAGLMNASPIMTEYWIKNQFGVIGNFLVSGKTPSNPINIQEKDYVMTGRSYNRFYDNRLLVQQQYDEVIAHDKGANPKYSYEEKYAVKETHTIYENTSKLLTDMREINKTEDLPEDIKASAYDLLLTIDSDEHNVDAIKPKLQKLADEVYDFKLKHRK